MNININIIVDINVHIDKNLYVDIDINLDTNTLSKRNMKFNRWINNEIILF